MVKVYMICDYSDKKSEDIKGCPDVGVENLGSCRGRILNEDGTEIGSHSSSTLDFLRSDLKRKLDNPEDYEIIDLIGKEYPDRFKA